MHFRETKNRIQALASVYDPTKKGPRQVLTWSATTEEAALKIRPKPGELLAGTEEQRRKWAEEIRAWLDERDKRMRAHSVAKSLPIVEAMLNMIVTDATSASPTLSTEDIERLRKIVHDASVRLYPRREPAEQTTRRTKPTIDSGDPRAFDTKLIDIAKAHRAAGNSIEKTAKLMADDGHNVSKSWIQKWTS